MKFLLDEMYPPALAQALLAGRINATTMAELGMAGSTDPDVFAYAVAENYAPRAMRGFGLDYDSLARLKPDLVMVSACLNGQTGPHRDYPGFGGQGSAHLLAFHRIVVDKH